MVNLLVVGGGRIALSHLPIIISKKNVNLVGIVDPSLKSRLILKNLFKVKTYSTSSKIPEASYDAVFILTPNSSHFSLAKSFLTKGKSVFIEKPLTTSYKQSLNLLEIAQSQGVILQCGYVNRFLDTFQEAKRLLSSNTIGNLISCNNVMKGNVVKAGQSKTWRTDGEGAGCLFDYGPHAIDIGIFLFGEPKMISVSEKGKKYSIHSDDWFKATLNYSDGFTQTIHCDWADDTVRKAENILTIYGEKGTLIVSKSILRVESIKGDVLVEHVANSFNTDVSFYLRGEEFSRQTSSFFERVSKHRDSLIDNLGDAVLVDKVIAEINNGGVL